MRKVALVAALAATAMMMAVAWAGNPHFVGTPTVLIVGDSITVHAKEAGLGNEAQIVAVLSGTAECINGGGHHPKAVNKTSFNTSSTEPVQNGMADYTLMVMAKFKPSCSPPMTVKF